MAEIADELVLLLARLNPVQTRALARVHESPEALAALNAIVSSPVGDSAGCRSCSVGGSRRDSQVAAGGRG